MKKILLTIACLLTSLAMVQAVSVKWTFNSSTTASSDPTGADFSTLGAGATWVIQLVEYSSDYASGLGGTDLATGALTGPPTFRLGTGITDVGDLSRDVYVRLYNATTIGAATYYVNLGVSGSTDYLVTTAAGASVQDAYTAEGVSGITGDSSARGTWIAIPEPGTMILFGLGSLVIAARRKFRK
jgi:hypothetical protein